jgi:hypothetical protein
MFNLILLSQQTNSHQSLAVCLAVFLVGPLATGEEPKKPDREKARQELVSKMAAELVEGYEVTKGKDETKLVLHKDPILRWSNPAAGSVYGDVYVWTADGRPEVLASVYRWYQPYRDQTVELHSLSTEQVVLGSKQKNKMWMPSGAGVDFLTVTDGPEPAQAAAQRLQQMRKLSAEFSMRLIDTREDKQKGIERELRMLSQPVFRYKSKNPELLDGAIFAFVEGTDPEAWLLLEARKKDGKFTWQFAFARMNNDELHGYLNKAEVWKAAKSDAPWLGKELVYGLFPIPEIPWEDVPRE